VLVPELSDGLATLLVMIGIGDHLMQERLFLFSAPITVPSLIWSRKIRVS